jgi:hypothetical protein
MMVVGSSQEVLEKNKVAVRVLADIAEKLVVIGRYRSPDEAIVAMALERLDQEIARYRAKIAAFEEKYGMTFEEFTTDIRGRATMQEEMDWEEWDDAQVMLEIRKRNRQEVEETS